MNKGYVIFNNEMGVFLGHCMGMGFWSALDAVGQDEAVAFLPDEATQAITDITSNLDGTFELKEVDNLKYINGTHYVSMEDCIKSGIPAWDATI